MAATLKNLKGGMNSPMMRALLDAASKGTYALGSTVVNRNLANTLSERLNRGHACSSAALPAPTAPSCSASGCNSKIHTKDTKQHFQFIRLFCIIMSIE